MARKNLIRQNDFPYHVYIRTNNKDWFQIPMFMMWDLAFECLHYARSEVEVDIHSFVLMKNHYHLLISTPNSDLDKFMELFNRRLSQKINKASKSINHKFANGYKWTIVDTRSYLFNIYRYIYQNPVRANLCKLCIDYPYTSLRFSPSQLRKLKIKTHIDYFKHREWMEERHGSDFDDVIRKALDKRVFKVPNRIRKPIKIKFAMQPLL